ncbi:MAG: indole-3-glycerol phosphate synthase TrpC [Ruminococcus sp.]|jgi:indole-3-glycerol phosphate synthase|nr:indole-3-glycerol phosphate synthase TrpC [Ruminococcus sp.]
MNILKTLADSAREITDKKKRITPLPALQQKITPVCDFPFAAALKKPGLSFICEVKKASPSKGIISEEFPYMDIAFDYEKGGADAISVLTEPTRFLGSDEILREISAAVKLPCLRKDFIVDEYQIYEAHTLGAKAVLLICSILSEDELKRFHKICDEIGLSALVEAHDEDEIHTALKIGAKIIGVNNRNLKDFSVDTDNARSLRKLVPDEILFVSESGIQSVDDAKAAYESGADAVLVGESLMKSSDRINLLREMKNETSKAQNLRY